MMLSEFNISFIPLKAIKGKAIKYFLANCLVKEPLSSSHDFPDEQVLYIKIE